MTDFNHDGAHDSAHDDPPLARLLADARALPREAVPPDDAWNEIRARIDAGRVQALAQLASDDTSTGEAKGGAAPTHVRVQRRAWRTLSAIAIAASVLAIVTISLRNGRVLRSAPAVAASGPTVTRGDSLIRDSARGNARGNDANDGVSSTMTSVLRRFDVAAANLTNELSTRRDRMDAAALATVDSALRTIDGAIAESRVALREAPDDPTIAGLLSAAYQQKLDLLRRAAELPQHSF